MMTSIEAELREHRRWKLRPEHRRSTIVDVLLNNEFAPRALLEKWQRAALQLIVRFAALEVPFYRDRFRALVLSANDIHSPDDLLKLPVLTRNEVIVAAESLRPARIPNGVRLTSATKSSGTTGRPVVVPTTDINRRMFTFLWHRQARWFRFRPEGVFCEIRDGGDIGRSKNGDTHPNGVAQKRECWKYLGDLFETGPAIGFNITNDVEQQLKWLQQYRPNYIMTDPSMLEELALVNGGSAPVDTIEAILAIAAQLDAPMRSRLERMYGVPIHQTYGLNEIGKVAVRCTAGRYHVHVEHCHVEIVDDSGQPCKPGEVGRIVVTALRNPAMPLIRYDTGDLATAVSGDCACGRTLPSFGEIIGRYRRYAGLPAGTRERFDAIQSAIADFPLGELGFLRQFQVHQFRDNRFELRLRTDGSIPNSFRQHMNMAWQRVTLDLNPLSIVTIENIPRTAGGKAHDFVSEFHQTD